MRQPPDLALIQAVKVRPRKRDEKNTALPSSRPMTRTTYRASLGQTLDSKNTLFAGKFQQRGQVRVYHISQAVFNKQEHGNRRQT
ncbi:uncharacterized protein LOC110436890 isoform X6 [Sorghum bicolor]|uniref:uncharacterized protein LOC110436890 isoform X6 n=1 Tax=Sorghum bicolor TaxID=4558 RepID=UPI000B424BF8|nr:uncharacterized protein LOC110436890 isoform X6 [Sorghum bicolor]|eukprot:XP_021320231.1 uncharacterized protein LOC110436890 isoform X6 [Sorghum bicolor]